MSGELNKLTTSVLLIILFVLCYKGYRKYQSNVLGISVTYEKNDRLQDFTLCPWFYNKNLQIADITSNSGHSIEDVFENSSFNKFDDSCNNEGRLEKECK